MTQAAALRAPSSQQRSGWRIGSASTCELVDVNRPYTVYFDWWVRQHAFRPYMKKFLAYYYNRSREWGMEVCVFYKWDGVMYECAVLDIERGQLPAINPAPGKTILPLPKTLGLHRREPF